MIGPLTSAWNQEQAHPLANQPVATFGFAERLIGKPLLRRTFHRRLRARRGPNRRLPPCTLTRVELVFWYVELSLAVRLYLQEVDGACVLAEEHTA